jgi:hypothetical protein
MTIKARTPGFGLCDICKMRFFFNRHDSISDMMYGAERWLESSPMNHVITRVELQHNLKQLAMLTCPHMRTNDAAFLNRVLTSPRGHMWNNCDNGRPFDDLFADTYELSGIRITCLNQACNTTVEIERKKGAGGMWPIQVRLRRNLGKMKDPMDPRWLIQLEKPES